MALTAAHLSKTGQLSSLGNVHGAASAKQSNLSHQIGGEIN
jgi:hypothetical protein